MKNFWTNKKVVIFGATGFIGSNIISDLVASGARVKAIVSESTTPKRLDKLSIYGKKVTIAKCNLLNLQDCIRASRGQNIVMNFAAMDGNRLFKRNHSAEILRTNTQIVLNILESSRQNKIDRTLIMSSIEIYRSNNPDGYVLSKRFSEDVSKLYTETYDTRVIIARPGNTYGPGDDAEKERERVIPAFVRKSLNGEDLSILGNGSQTASFLYVTDLTRTLLKLIQNYSSANPVDIVSSNEISVLSLARKIAKLTGKKSKVKFTKEDIGVKSDSFKKLKIKSNIKVDEEVSLDEGLKKTIEFYLLQDNKI